MINPPSGDSARSNVDFGPLREERARIDRILARLDETADLTERADLGSELVRSASRYQDTVERTLYPLLPRHDDVDQDRDRGDLTQRLTDLRQEMTIIHERTMHIDPRNVHTSDPQGFEDALEAVVRLLRSLLRDQDAELEKAVCSLSAEEAQQLRTNISHAFKTASERPTPPRTTLGRLVANANVKLDHTFEDVATPQHPGAETIDG
jgi:hypothetical protein